MPAGFESLAVGELEERAISRRVEPRRGWVRFETRSGPEDLLELRSFFRLYAHVGTRHGIPADRSGLARLERVPDELDWDDAMERWRAWFPWARAQGRPGDEPAGEPPDPPSFRVTVRRSGEHEYNSQEAAGALGAGVQRRFGWPVDLEHYDVEIFGHLAGDELVLGVTLTSASMHFADDVDRGRTGLKLPVAHGLVRLADPRDGEVVVDPMGGVGTLPIEAARFRPEALHVCGEIRREELSLAARNAAAVGVDVTLARWDVQALPLREGSVDCVICDLPFGRRVGSHRRNRHLYPAALREMARVLRAHGRAVLLSTERRLMNRVVERTGPWKVESVRRVHYGGLDPRAYVLRRAPGGPGGG